ncbi:VirK/YbjX family protein [Ideonella sp.]|uniref:VirK/YbjX family protein n=1 Tax=Ideonella sp. TaxID=1929293 RepID=UPI002B4868D6|nr:DUF535 family protein [Ideonella sp.]HJV68111.1 DUF535 family protein [Ideonella sp.]
MRGRAGRLLAQPGSWQALGLLVGFMPGEVTGLPQAFEPALALWLVIWQGARQAYPALDPLSLVRRLRFGWQAWRKRREWRALRQVPPQSQLGRALQARGGMVHVIAWPYIHRAWSVRQRVDTVVAHYRQIERHLWLQVPFGSRRVLATVGAPEAGLTLQIDQPSWLAQEGELALNLFDGDLRLYSVGFSFGQRQGQPVVYIGAIQGRSVDGANERYAELTRQLHGCRPRDLVLLALLMIAEAMGIERAYGICDYYRHFRQPRLLARLDTHVASADYDEIWRDRGGAETVDGFFAIDTRYSPRPLDEVPTKKRAMYRRRYEMLGELRASLHGRAQANRLPDDLLHTSAR